MIQRQEYRYQNWVKKFKKIVFKVKFSFSMLLSMLHLSRYNELWYVNQFYSREKIRKLESTFELIDSFARMSQVEYHAVCLKLEEFYHSSIFGIKKSHHLWIMGQKEEAISKRLKSLRLRVSYVELNRRNIFTQLFKSIFLYRI
jgi:hypothetical protein